MASSKATVAVVLFLVLSVAQALKVYTLAGTGEIGTSGDGSLGYYAKASPMRVAVDNVRKVLYFSDFQTIRAVNLTNGIVYRVAGTTQGFSGDNDLAVNAKLNNPAGLCVDTNGNLYIADSGNNRIRLVTLSSGNITTYAGTGTAAFGGDNGNRLSASMNSPSDVACDPSGRLFIADTENSRVRVVSASGTMTTFAGTAGSGYNGDGIAATSAKLNYPVGIAYDASLGHLVIADTLNYRIRVVDSGTIQTIAGTGTGAYSDNGNSIQSGTKYPVSVTYLGQRKVLFADRLACVVRLVDYSDQTISTFLGVPNSCAFNGDSTSDVAQIKEPQSVQYDQVNNVAYIADKDNYRVRGVADTVPSFVPTGATTTTVSPSSPVSSPSPGSASPSPASPSPASSGSPVSSTAPVIVSNSLVAWGDNPYSFFGIDTSAPAVLVPTKVVSSVDMDIIHVSASGASSMFVTSDNKVYVSGDNSLGQLGINSKGGTHKMASLYTAGALAGKTILSAEIGYYHGAVLTTDGKVYTFGANSIAAGSSKFYGLLGQDLGRTDANVLQATAISMKDVPDTNVVSLAVGQTTTYFVTADNLAYSFGIGVLGDSKFFSSGTPVRIKTTALNGNVISAVVAIGPSAFIIDKSGNWYAWGTNELGVGSYETSILEPTAIVMSGAIAGKKIVQVATEPSHSLFLTSDNLLFSAGHNEYGQSAQDKWDFNSNVPAAVNMTAFSGKTIIKIACSNYASMVLTSDGLVYQFGSNQYGELANGAKDKLMHNTPVVQTTMVNVKGIWGSDGNAKFAKGDLTATSINPTQVPTTTYGSASQMSIGVVSLFAVLLVML